MITVEAIEEIDKVRRRIILSSGEQFWLYRSDLRELHLKVGSAYEQEEVDALLLHRVKIYARKKVLELLERMDRSEAQLRQKLKDREFSLATIDDAIAYAKKFHYIDDMRYAIGYINARVKVKSKKQMQYALGMKGISSLVFYEAYEKVMEELSLLSGDEQMENPEVAAVRRQMKKKISSVGELSYEEKQKLIASFYRKGYSLAAIRQAMDSEIE